MKIVTVVPFHPQAQFLKDVDGDGEVDHLYCCEAAALELINDAVKKGAIAHFDGPLSPLYFEEVDTFSEASYLFRDVSDAGFGFAFLALLLRERPIVVGDRAKVKACAAAYRAPVDVIHVEPVEMSPNHDLLVVGYDDSEGKLVLHCTYNGVCTVDFDEFDKHCWAVASLPCSDVPTSFASMSEAAIALLESTSLPVIASVNVKAMSVKEKTGVVPFVVVTEKSWWDDWVEGHTCALPTDKTDRLLYLDAIVNSERYPVYEYASEKTGDDWLKWLSEREHDILKKPTL